MTTTWQNEVKRQVGNETTLMNDTVVLFNGTQLMGGANPPTTWTLETKTA